MITPREAIDNILDKVLATLKEDGSHAPILFVFGQKENAIALLDFKDTESKHEMMLAAGRRARYLEPYCIAFVSEAWFTKELPPEDKEIHDMPDKQECLHVTAQSKDSVTESATIPFNRVGEGIFLGETMYAPYTESYLLSLFWQGVNEQQQD